MPKMLVSFIQNTIRLSSHEHTQQFLKKNSLFENILAENLIKILDILLTSNKISFEFYFIKSLLRSNFAFSQRQCDEKVELRLQSSSFNFSHPRSSR